MGIVNETSLELETDGQVLTLGDHVKDKISAATGTVFAIAFYLYAPPRVGVSLDNWDCSKGVEECWFDAPRLERSEPDLP